MTRDFELIFSWRRPRYRCRSVRKPFHLHCCPMSRDIFIGYRYSNGPESTVEIRAPYYLFGTQQTSKQFWSLPIWASIGVTRLAELGHSDPINFIGWEMIGELAREIRLFQDNFERIEFDADVKSWFLAHLVYCHSLLITTAPKESIPELTIG